jgi:hypothetical protein
MVAPNTVAEFKAYFDRDFTYGTAKSTVRDADITKALAQANALFNPGLWEAGTDLEIAFHLLSAHCLVTNLNAAGGINGVGRGVNSTGSFAINSKGAGPLSVSYAIPQDMKDNPVLNQFLTTRYGQQYLEMLTPNLIGNVDIALGATTA